MKAQLINIVNATKSSVQIKVVDQKYLTAPFHFHDMCELVFIQKSFGKRIVGDHVGNFKDGDLVLMGPDLPHIWLNDNTFRHPRSKKKVQAIVAYFSPTFLTHLSYDKSITSHAEDLIFRSHRGLYFFGRTREIIKDKMDTMVSEKGLKRIIAFLNIIDTLSASNEYQYLASIGFKNSFSPKDTDRLNTVYQYLNKNFTEKISLRSISDMVNMSPSAFCRFFKARTQKSFSLFMNELRIAYACRLLLSDELSITSIAFESGYQNLTNFNKFFRKITGTTPSLYKKQFRFEINSIQHST